MVSLQRVHSSYKSLLTVKVAGGCVEGLYRLYERLLGAYRGTFALYCCGPVVGVLWCGLIEGLERA